MIEKLSISDCYCNTSKQVVDLALVPHNYTNPFCLVHAAKPAKRQAAAQPAPSSVAQPVATPIAPNGNEYFMFSISHAKSIIVFGEAL